MEIYVVRMAARSGRQRIEHRDFAVAWLPGDHRTRTTWISEGSRKPMPVEGRARRICRLQDEGVDLRPGHRDAEDFSATAVRRRVLPPHERRRHPRLPFRRRKSGRAPLRGRLRFRYRLPRPPTSPNGSVSSVTFATHPLLPGETFSDGFKHVDRKCRLC